MRELRKLLYRFGIYKTQEGYAPLLVAVELILEDPERLSCLSRRLYPTGDFLCMLHNYMDDILFARCQAK